MTTITAPLRRSPRTVRTPSAPVSARARQILKTIRRRSESINGDHRATLCDLTLRPYSEARTLR